MKILVTGGAGFIGSHIVEHYQDKAEEIRVLDNLRTGYLKNLDGLKHTFIEGSICDRELVRQAVQGVDYIFHMAALVSVPESMSKISECIDINVNGLLNVLEEASAAGVKKIVLASSAAIYGDNPTVPKLETMYPEPKSPYAITNMGGTMRLGAYECVLQKGSKAYEAYGTEHIQERHRHRYEFNNSFKDAYEAAGMKCVGINPESDLVEIVEIPALKWFVGTQFHPEYSSTVLHPHPLFVAFVKAAIENENEKK